MASSDENVSDSDEDMISCQICLLRFNTENRKPKFLDCHHYFCLSCIQSFSKPNVVSCPTCRTKTDLTARKIERLTTNNIALRLVTISEDRARERQKHETVEKEIMDQQLWCSECNMSATNECHKKEHAILSYFDIYNSHSSLLKSVISEANAVCDRALEHHHKIYSTHLEMFAKVRWLESQIILRIESSKATISHLESLKAKEDFKKVPEEEDMVNTLNQMNQLIIQISERSDTAKAAELEAYELLQTYGSNGSTFLISLLQTEQGQFPEGLGSNTNNVDKCGELDDPWKKKYGLSRDEINMVVDEAVKSQDYIKQASCSKMETGPPNLELSSQKPVEMRSVNSTLMMPPYLMPPPHMLPPPTIMPPLCTIPPPHMMKHPPPLFVGPYGLAPTFQDNEYVGMPMLFPE